MALLKEPNCQPLPGYRLIEPLGSGGFGDVWKCEAPGGIFKAIKFVDGLLDGLGDQTRAEAELRALQRIKTIRHPFLLSIDRIEAVNGELLIVTELADQNLEQVLRKYQHAGLPGIPRIELLNWLREAAEVLDLFNLQYHLQHLDIKPRNLFLVGNHVKVADFGLVKSLNSSSRQGKGNITLLYAAPETFLGKISRHSDQYSLAIVYQELLTGTLPFTGENARQLLFSHTQNQPDLSLLPEPDREVLAKALSKEPSRRYPSCSAMIKALVGEGRSAAPDTAVGVGPATMPAIDLGDTIGTPATRDLPPGASPETAPKRRKSPALPAALAGYHLLDNIASSPLMEQWQAVAPDGKARLMKFAYGFSQSPGPALDDLIGRLQSIQHPALVATHRVLGEPGRLVLVTEHVNRTLRERFHECQERKQPGIPRRELLDCLRAAAEALDYLFEQHSLYHLGLNPKTIMLPPMGPQIADFGLAHLLWLPGGQDIARSNARYAAPELAQGKPSRASDQYSLALIFAEMLTGTIPLRGRGEQGAGAQRGGEQRDFDKLSQRDRQVLGRALDPDPNNRFPSCMALIQALKGTEVDISLPIDDRFARMLSGPRDLLSAPLPAMSASLPQMIRDLVASAGGSVSRGDQRDEPMLFPDDAVLRYRFTVGMPLGAARVRLESFGPQCFGELVGHDETGFVFHVDMPAGFWRQLLGRKPQLEIQVRLTRVNPQSVTPVEIAVEARALRAGRKEALRLLEQVGPNVLGSLRNHLLINAEKRAHERLLWPHPVHVRPRYAGHIGDPVECRGKDLSLSGIGFFLPDELDTAEVVIDLPNTVHPPVVSVPATLVRARRTADGWYEVGALFHLPAPRKSEAEIVV